MADDPHRPNLQDSEHDVRSTDSRLRKFTTCGCFLASLGIAVWFNVFFFPSRFGIWPWYLSPREAWMDQIEFLIFFGFPLAAGLSLAYFAGRYRGWLFGLYAVGVVLSLI